MSDRGETQDFMSVDTFSQLPFISRRNAPSSRIRLFGFDFPPHASESNNNRSSIAATSARGSEVITGSTSTATAAAATKDVGKKFECQYCFRNFPTSQALGGHQNAHKRERQYAKRAYLAESHLNHQIDNQNIMGLSASSAAWFSFHHTRPPPHYPSWSLAGSGMAGGEGNFYAGLGPLGSMAPPINSRPVLGQLRSQVPAPQMTLFQGEDRRMTSGGGAASWSPSSSSSYTSTWQGEWHSLEPKDGVTSLDLRL